MKITKRIRAELAKVGDVLIIPSPAENGFDAYVCLETITSIKPRGDNLEMRTEWAFGRSADSRGVGIHTFNRRSYVTKL